MKEYGKCLDYEHERVRRGEIYRMERDNGMTIKKIAEKYGVSTQAVYQAAGRQDRSKFIFVEESQCIYPKWRNWMNGNKISRSELCRRMYGAIYPKMITLLSGYMKGKDYPTKITIDRLLAATGLAYEELFWREES